MRRRSILLGATAALFAPAVVGTAPARAGGGVAIEPVTTTRPLPVISNIASRMKTLPAGTEQLIVVHGESYATTYATLSMFVKFRSTWRQIADLPARIGSKGFSDNHVEGVATTPTGMYSIGSTMYGIAANPGVRYPYHQLVTDDWWDENSESPGYNTFHHGSDPGGPSEALWTEVPAYTHFAVITYNMPPNVPTPVPYAGSAIFLHEFSVSTGNATAGCVSLSHTDLLKVLNWLDPARSPRIVLSPTDQLSRY